RANLLAGIQERAEVAVLLRRQRQGVHEAGVHDTVVVKPVKIEEEKGLIAAIVDFRDYHRSAYRDPPVVLGQRKTVREKESSGVQLATRKIVVQVAMQLVRA